MTPSARPPLWGHILGLALVGTGIGWTSLFWLAKMSMVAAGIAIILIPVLTVLYKRMQGTKTGWHQLAGAALIVGASSVLIALVGLR